MYLDDKGDVVKGLSTEGYLAVGVPGPVMGFEVARSRYGTKPLAELIAPAIALAKDGFVLEQGDIDSFDGETDRLAKDPAAAAIFLKDGKPFVVGEKLVQTDLAASLSGIAEKGTDAFYKGAIADAPALGDVTGDHVHESVQSTNQGWLVWGDKNGTIGSFLVDNNRVLSPPTSITAAPSSAICRARSRAAATVG